MKDLKAFFSERFVNDRRLLIAVEDMSVPASAPVLTSLRLVLSAIRNAQADIPVGVRFPKGAEHENSDVFESVIDLGKELSLNVIPVMPEDFSRFYFQIDSANSGNEYAANLIKEKNIKVVIVPKIELEDTPIEMFPHRSFFTLASKLIGPDLDRILLPFISNLDDSPVLSVRETTEDEKLRLHAEFVFQY